MWETISDFVLAVFVWTILVLTPALFRSFTFTSQTLDFFGYKFNTTPNNNWPSASGKPCDIVVSDQSNNATRVALNNTYASVEPFNFCTLHLIANSNIGIWLNWGVSGVTSGSSDPEPPRAVPTLQFHLSFLPPTLWLEELLKWSNKSFQLLTQCRCEVLHFSLSKFCSVFIRCHCRSASRSSRYRLYFIMYHHLKTICQHTKHMFWSHLSEFQTLVYILTPNAL